MSVSPAKTWIANEILTAADLNSEFLNIYNNGQDIGFPRGEAAAFKGFKLLLDDDGNTSIRADTDDQIDIEIGGVDTYKMTATEMTILGKRVLTIDDLRTIGIEGIRAIVHSNQNRITQFENDTVLAARSYTF